MNIDYQMKQMVNIFGEERVRNSLKNLAEIEADKCRFKIQKVRQKLAVFEDRYHKDSEKAWEEYQQGRLGDDTDIMEWMAFYENLLDFQDEFNRISDSRVLW